MKKILALCVLAALLVGGWWVYSRFMAPPEARACARLADLCNAAESDAKESDCAQGLQEMKKVAGEKAVERATACIAEADSCINAAGCMVGAGVGAFGEFLEGMQKALEK